MRLFCDLDCTNNLFHANKGTGSPVSELVLPCQATFTGLGTTWLAANRNDGMGK